MNRTIFLSSKRRSRDKHLPLVDIIELEKDVRVSQYIHITTEQFYAAINILEQIDLPNEQFFEACLFIRQYFNQEFDLAQSKPVSNTHQVYDASQDFLQSNDNNSLIMSKLLIQLRHIQALFLTELDKFINQMNRGSQNTSNFTNSLIQHLPTEVLKFQARKLKEIYWLVNYHNWFWNYIADDNVLLCKLLACFTDRTQLEVAYGSLCGGDSLQLPFDGYLLDIQSLQCNLYINMMLDLNNRQELLKQSQVLHFIKKHFSSTLQLLSSERAKESVQIQNYLSSYIHLIGVYVKKTLMELTQLDTLMKQCFAGYLDEFTTVNPQVLSSILKVSIIYFDIQQNITPQCLQKAYQHLILPVFRHRDSVSLEVLCLACSALYEIVFHQYQFSISHNIFLGIQTEICAVFEFIGKLVISSQKVVLLMGITSKLLKTALMHQEAYQWEHFHVKDVICGAMAVARKVGVVNLEMTGNLADFLCYNQYLVANFQSETIQEILNTLLFIFQIINNKLDQKPKFNPNIKEMVGSLLQFMTNLVIQCVPECGDGLGMKYMEYMRECGLIGEIERLSDFPIFRDNLSIHSFLSLQYDE